MNLRFIRNTLYAVAPVALLALPVVVAAQHSDQEKAKPRKIQATPTPSPTMSPTPSPSPTMSPTPSPSPTTSPTPSPSPTTSPSPSPSPSTSPSPGCNLATRFRGLDRNGDCMITRDEWRGSDTSFRQHDWNGDGVLSGDEVRPGARRPLSSPSPSPSPTPTPLS